MARSQLKYSNIHLSQKLKKQKLGGRERGEADKANTVHTML